MIDCTQGGCKELNELKDKVYVVERKYDIVNLKLNFIMGACIFILMSVGGILIQYLFRGIT